MRGYSLIETLVVLGIITVLGGVVVTAYQGTLNAQNPKAAASVLYASLVDASLRARTMELDSPWGVEVLAGKIVTFKGASYAGRDTSKDRPIAIAPSLTTSGMTEVVFAKFTGLPSATGTTTFTSSLTSSSVYVPVGGAISYQP
jgi:type II secretory pathway pseudopilin PulG